jgi:radical SAM family uncharacterized protein
VQGVLPIVPDKMDAPTFIGQFLTAGNSRLQAQDVPFAYRLHTLRLPSRYIGGEKNSCEKSWDNSRFRLALGFPDLYELGMSYLGMQVLYSAVNSPELQPFTQSYSASGPFLCERFFLPDTDARELMASSNHALRSLESAHPLSAFDAVGISFTHERSYLNLPAILKLSGIPLMQADRQDSGPLIIGGGACMLNPEPIADMLDVVAIGDGEELILKVASCLSNLRGAPRLERLKALSQISGIYIPSFYEPLYSQGRFGSLNVKDGFCSLELPKRIRRRILRDFDQWTPPTKLVIPWVDTPGNWANIEIMRGCPRRCRFCHAGHVYLPARYRSAEDVISACLMLCGTTGTDQVSMQGLSVLDHPQILEILEKLRPELDKRMISLSVPSLRMDAVSRQVASLMRRPKESSLTFAPEAGSAEMRAAINKQIGEGDITETITRACEAGWHKFKLYFMCGFPGEVDTDIEAIVLLTREIKRIARTSAPHPPHINVSINALIPKPHTPMQWAPLVSEDDLRKKHDYLRGEFVQMGNSVHFSYTGYQEAFLETLLSRGDRRLAPVISHACELGICDYEGKTKELSSLISDCQAQGINAVDEVHRERNTGEALPWDHISTGVSKNYLAEEWNKYHSRERSQSCNEACSGCGLCL